jgi:hypothetical protein
LKNRDHQGKRGGVGTFTGVGVPEETVVQTPLVQLVAVVEPLPVVVVVQTPLVQVVLAEPLPDALAEPLELLLEEPLL